MFSGKLMAAAQVLSKKAAATAEIVKQMIKKKAGKRPAGHFPGYGAGLGGGVGDDRGRYDVTDRQGGDRALRRCRGCGHCRDDLTSTIDSDGLSSDPRDRAAPRAPSS
jgi:hypothetical protein